VDGGDPVNRRSFLRGATASAAAALATAIPASATTATPNARLITRAACIRLGPGGPRIHENAVHGNRGVTHVGMNSAGDLVVHTDWKSGESLIYAAATIDFQLGDKGVTCGVSGGGPMSTIRFRDGRGVRHRANSSYFNFDYDNIWFLAITEAPGEP
jgi:hypothetical protein